MPAKQEYIAHGKTNQEITEAIGADWLIYQTLEDLEAAVIDAGGGRVTQFDTSCFTGNYVCGTITTEYLAAVESIRNDGAKKSPSSTDETLDIHNQE